MMNEKLLVNRWNTTEGIALAVDSAFRLVSDESFAGSEVGQHEGRWDLRGFRLPSPTAVGRFSEGRLNGLLLEGTIRVRDANWSDLDLSSSILPSLRFFHSTLENCRLDNARCSDWRLWGCDIQESSFVATNLRDSVIGTWSEGRGNHWQKVNFVRADLRGASMDGSIFEDCDFSRAKLGSIQFLRSSLRRVKFSGQMKGVLFDLRDFEDEPEPDPGPLIDVDFSAAVFDSVEFRGCYFHNVRFPPDPGLRLIPHFPVVAKRELELLAGDESSVASGLRAILDKKLPGAPDSTGIFSRSDLVSWGGEEFAALSERTLDQALDDLGLVGRKAGEDTPPIDSSTHSQ